MEKGTSTGTITNVYGFYSLTLPAGIHTISYTYIGFESQTMEVDFNEDKSIDVRLSLASAELEEVVVRAEKKDENITSTNMSVERLNMKQLEKVPVLMGEAPVYSASHLMGFFSVFNSDALKNMEVELPLCLISV